jgi:hypothetical protein
MAAPVPVASVQLLRKAATSSREDRITRMKERFRQSFAYTPDVKLPPVSRKFPKFQGFAPKSSATPSVPQFTRARTITFADDVEASASNLGKRERSDPAGTSSAKLAKKTPRSILSSKRGGRLARSASTSRLPKADDPLSSTVFKLEISNPNFNRVITLKSPVKSGRNASLPSPDIDEVFKQLRKTLKENPSLRNSQPPASTAAAPPPAHSSQSSSILSSSDWLTYVSGGLPPDQ